MLEHARRAVHRKNLNNNHTVKEDIIIGEIFKRNLNTTNTTMHPSLEGHRAHIRALVIRERNTAYQRHDFLSREWQLDLWREEVKRTTRLNANAPVLSPTSVTLLADGDGAATPLAPSEICVGRRERSIEWQYQVVDGLGETPTLSCCFQYINSATNMFSCVCLFLRSGPRNSQHLGILPRQVYLHALC